MVKATRPSWIDRSLMNPRLTMSRCRSGSRTTFSASSTEPCSTAMTPRISYTCPDMTDVDASPNRGVMIVLAYLWPLAVVPLLLEKRDPDVQWHARHSLTLMVSERFLIVVCFAIASVVSLASMGLGLVLMLALVCGWVGILTVHVIAIIKGIGG